jgi:hypothetical protein
VVVPCGEGGWGATISGLSIRLGVKTAINRKCSNLEGVETSTNWHSSKHLRRGKAFTLFLMALKQARTCGGTSQGEVPLTWAK